MKSYKEKQFIIFELDDNSVVRYDLSKKECIGKLGKPVKKLNTQLKDISISEVIDSFSDENFKCFLRDIYRCYNIRNIGTLLSKIEHYSNLEQIYSAGLRVEGIDFRYKIQDIPKILIKFCKENDIKITERLLKFCKENLNIFQVYCSEDFVSLGVKQFIYMTERTRYHYPNRTNALSYIIKNYNYNTKSFLHYVDYLMTYEALNYSIISEIYDYLNMVSAISPKFEKYPKNFLTTHKIATRNYNRLKKEYSEELFQRRIKKNLEFSYGGYKIIYPSSTQDIKDEAISMNHCVASYIDRVMDGYTDILFLRKADSPDVSLVTLEVTNNKVTQAKRSFNNEPSAEEWQIIDKYEQFLIRKGEHHVA